MTTIDVWTDGSGTWGANSPACIGVHILVDGVACVEASEFVGMGTNNVAELRAIRRGLFLADQLVHQFRADVRDVAVREDIVREVREAFPTAIPTNADEVDAMLGFDVIIHSDSEYAIASISEWDHPRANVEIIRAIRRQIDDVYDAHGGRVSVRWEHVRGHAGVMGNEIADWLAHVARCRAKDVEMKRTRPGDPKPPRAMRKRAAA